MIDRLGWPVIAAAVIAIRWICPPRDLDALGAVALRDLALSLLFWLLIVALATGLGLSILRRLSAPEPGAWLGLVLAAALGLGAVGYAVLGLGLAGAAGRVSISALILGIAALAGPQVTHGLRLFTAGLRRLPSELRQAWPAAKLGATVVAAIAILSLINSLPPPSDYDGLMYHLVTPLRLIEDGRLAPDSDNWYTNGPSTLEMLFSLGMAYGDDTFPKLIHWTAGALLVAATFAAARIWLPQGSAWLAPLILLGSPALPVWATFAYIDLAWALFEFLALVAVLHWWRTQSNAWLLLAGILTGLAMGTKYLGLMGALVWGLLVLAVSFRQGWRASLRSALTFGGAAALVALPWYLKNLLWFGNPVYPLVLGGPGWDAARLARYAQYLDSFGVGRSLRDFILLPVNLYLQHAQFGAVMNRIDIPSVLLPLAIAFPFLRRAKPPALTLLLAASVARAGVWAVGSQQTRFLLPVFPGLALAAGYVLATWSSGRNNRMRAAVAGALAAGLASATLFYQVVVLVQNHSLQAVLGVESRRAYLSRTVWDFRGIMRAVEQTGENGHVLLIGDGRGYYCLPVCIPDPDHFRWSAEIAELETPAQFTRLVSTYDLTHILVSWEDLDFLLQHDTAGIVRAALTRLGELQGEQRLQAVYEDEWTMVLRVSGSE